MALKLIIGNKNYSSWSFRPWIAMKTLGIPFDEEVVPLHTPQFKARLPKISGTGKVPVLIDGDTPIWESLAILEHLAERYPKSGMWPSDLKARAHARVVAAEMHAGFVPLRNHCPMNMRRPVKPRPLSAEVDLNVKRIDALWSDCRARFGKDGPFLFGAFSAADAMYAPVVSRFHTYAIGASAPVRTYMSAMMALPAWREWQEAGSKETWVLDEDEVD
ncbi:MAG: glutathione S-transferase family protein [Rhizobiales bacterium]|nr:glutathione S-transferase family protein [Hyphomicrobiales bacterium]